MLTFWTCFFQISGLMVLNRGFSMAQLYSTMTHEKRKTWHTQRWRIFARKTWREIRYLLFQPPVVRLKPVKPNQLGIDVIA